MAIKKVTFLTCDHVMEDGTACLVERPQNKIDPVQPMYRVQITIEQIIPEGITKIVEEDVVLCYWDLFNHLCRYHDLAKDLVNKFKEQEARRLEAMNNDE